MKINMIPAWMQYASPLRNHEMAVLTEVYKAVIPVREYDIGRQIKRGVVKWHNYQEYDINLNIEEWAFPRLWDTPIVEGYDRENQLLAKYTLEVLFGLPIRLNIYTAQPMTWRRNMPTPTRLDMINYDKVTRRPPLPKVYMDELENKNGILIPEDLYLFLTSNEFSEYRHAINPFTESELIEPDEHIYYRIFNGAGIHDLIIRLGRSGRTRDRLSKVFLIDYVKHEEIFFSEGIKEAVNKFVQIHRDDIFILKQNKIIA